MDLEKVTAKIRPRRGWEAIDLGITMVQTHAKVLYTIWFAISLPIFLLLSLTAISAPMFSLYIFWWLKPILERPLLHFLSRELFGESLTAKQCIKSFFSVAKIQWFASLTWRRFSFTRSFDLPLIQLEGLKGSERSKRLRVIHSGDSSSAVWLHIMFSVIESIMYFSVIALIYILVPEVYLENFNLFDWFIAESESGVFKFFFDFLAYLAISLVAPFYVACGFALYLNQRTHLEAWDIELSFKRLAVKLKDKSENFKARLASIIFVCLIAGNIAMPKIVQAQQSTETVQQEVEQQKQVEQEEQGQELSTAEMDESNSAITAENTQEYQTDDESLENITHQQAKEMILAIKEGKDFHQLEKEESNSYRPDEDSKDEEEVDDGESFSMSPIWVLISGIVALIVEFALWIFIAVFFIFLMIKYRHLLVSTMPNKKIKQNRPKKLFGLDLQSDSLPDKPWLVAKSLINENKFREALSLLYRASLVWYIDNSDVVIKEGYTELECLNKISQHVEKDSQCYLQNLTHKWRALAYAHIMPKQQDLLSLCDQWPLIMKSATEQPSESSLVVAEVSGG